MSEGAQFCGTCGSRIGASSAPADPFQRFRSHVRTIGILWAVFGAFRILTGVWTLTMSRFMLPMITGMIPHDTTPFPFPMIGFLRSIFFVSFILEAVSGVLGAIAAWGLLQREPWGRMLALIVAFISLISIPLGTALGAYTLVILLPSAAGTDYERVRTTA